jgi:hypothetical protein
MAFGERVSRVIALGASFLLISCTHRQAPVQQDISSLVEIAGIYRQSSHPPPLEPLKPVAAGRMSPTSDNGETEGEYGNQVATYLVEKNCEALEQAAREARTKKARFNGDVWKLYISYDGLGKPTLGAEATDEDWNYHIGRVKDWEAAPSIRVRPDYPRADLFIVRESSQGRRIRKHCVGHRLKTLSRTHPTSRCEFDGRGQVEREMPVLV